MRYQFVYKKKGNACLQASRAQLSNLSACSYSHCMYLCDSRQKVMKMCNSLCLFSYSYSINEVEEYYNLSKDEHKKKMCLCLMRLCLL